LDFVEVDVEGGDCVVTTGIIDEYVETAAGTLFD
jgi:hypothetical protein